MVVALGLECDPAARLALHPDRASLGPGERRSMRVLASARGLGAGRTRVRLVGEIRAGERLLGREVAELSMVIPERP